MGDERFVSELCFVASSAAIDGAWSEWSSWSTCNPECLHYRRRSCTEPVPQFGGKPCSGLDLEAGNCTGGMCSGTFLLLFLPFILENPTAFEKLCTKPPLSPLEHAKTKSRPPGVYPRTFLHVPRNWKETSWMTLSSLSCQWFLFRSTST
jgi:hypothetical protein